MRETGHAFTPEKTRSMEAVVRTLGLDAMCGASPLDCALWLTIRVYLMPPKSWSAKKRTNTVHVTGRPDADNQVKLLGDALNGICWRDDAQISAVTIQRLYTQAGPERAEVSFGDWSESLVVLPCAGRLPQSTPLFKGAA